MEWNFTQTSLAAGPVSRILSAGMLLQDGHSSRPGIAARLKRPTRRFDAPSQHVSEPESGLPPYLVLLRVGFALPIALLRRRCALTAPFHPYPDVAARAVYFLWHFPSSPLPSLPKAGKDEAPSRTLSGTLLCGVRTFLCFTSTPARQERAATPVRQRPSGPAANRFIIVQAHRARGLAPAARLASYSLGASRNGYNSRARPINNGIRPAR